MNEFNKTYEANYRKMRQIVKIIKNLFCLFRNIKDSLKISI